MTSASSFSDLLGGSHAFYDQADYVEKTQKDFAQETPLPVQYTWNSGYKIRTIDVLFGLGVGMGVVGMMRGERVLAFALISCSVYVKTIASFFPTECL